MPSNLYLNENVTFICGKNFIFAGVPYEVGDEFDQELSPGRIEQLVRTRHVYPVVDDRADKTRFFHREVHVREDIERILSKDRGKGQIKLVRASEPEVVDTGEPADPGASLRLQAKERLLTKEVLEEENSEVEEGDEEPEVVEEELFDPTEHTVVEVEDYLMGEITQEENNRVIAAEKLGKNRKGIVGDG